MTFKTTDTRLLRGYIFSLIATIIWSGNFIIARGLSSEISPVSLAFYRWSVAVIVFLPFSIGQIIANFQVLKKHKLYICLNAFLGISLFNTLIYFAGHSTTVLNMSMISITFPIFILIISRIFFKEKITFRKFIGIIIVFFGAVLLVNKGHISSLFQMDFAIGDLWMLLAAITFAIYSVLLKLRPVELKLIPFQQSSFIVGLFFLTPFFVYEQMNNPHLPSDFNLNIIFALLYAGIFASLVAFMLWNKAISVIGPVKTGMVYYSLPVFGFIEASLFLNETIYLYHIICLFLILSGILLAIFETKSEKKQQ